MLNEELIPDLEKAKLKITVQQLQKTIQAFKGYDEERKKYYSDRLIELGELKSYIEELEDKDSTIPKLKRQIKAMKLANNKLKERLKKYESK
jgi:predicted RNase H-like nuclease (RuvC/YqgF family)